MNREEKKKVRKRIGDLLDTKCNTCSFKKIGTYCIDSCPVGLTLQQLSYSIVSDDNKGANLGILKNKPWNENEDLYLINHIKYFSIDHLSNRLNRSQKSVMNRLQILKQNNLAV